MRHSNELGSITKLEPDQIRVALDSGREVTFHPEKFRHIDHGYAVTSHSSQGLTVDRVVVNADTTESVRLLNDRMAYVAVSRAREEALIYTDSTQNLRETLNRGTNKEMALEATRDNLGDIRKDRDRLTHDPLAPQQQYRGSIPEARVKAQAERAEVTIRDSVYEGIYGKSVDAPKLRDFIAETFLPWAKTNERTWVHDEFRSRPLIEAMGNKTMDAISPILIEKYKRDRRGSKTARGTERAPSTVNRELELLSKIFSLAIDQGLAIPNPCQKVKRFREDNERNRYLSDEEEPRLLSVLTGPRASLRRLSFWRFTQECVEVNC